MKTRNVLVFAILSLSVFTATANSADGKKESKIEEPMTNARLEQILKNLETTTKGGSGRWEMVRDGILVLILTDESHNRMRMIAPAMEAKELDQQTLTRMMEANFASALDVRYAIYKGVVWSAFIHPLDSLREQDIIAALRQVTTLVKTTGTTFSSSELHFGPSHEEK